MQLRHNKDKQKQRKKAKEKHYICGKANRKDENTTK